MSEVFSIKEIMQQNQGDKKMSMDMFKQLFIRSDQMPHLMLSDVNRIVNSLQKDFPEIIKV